MPSTSSLTARHWRFISLMRARLAAWRVARVSSSVGGRFSRGDSPCSQGRSVVSKLSGPFHSATMARATSSVSG